MEKLIAKVVALIVRCCDPEEVVLFGSYPKRGAGPNSDLDFLVVGDFHRSRYLRSREVREVVSGFAIRIDVQLVTPDELATAEHDPYSFFPSVRIHGVTVYRRSSGPNLVVAAPGSPTGG